MQDGNILAGLTRAGWPGRRWAVTADGQRFVLNKSIKNPLPGITFTKNWLAAMPKSR